MADDIRSWWSTIIGTIGFALSLITFVGFILSNQTHATGITGAERLYTILLLGLAAAIGYGLLWSLAERAFGWEFGAGGGSSLPTGWQAIILSLSLTLPLTFVPLLFQTITGKVIVPTTHYQASAAMNLTSALGHIIWYGSPLLKFRGLRNVVFPIDAPADLKKYIMMEALAAIMHFGTIVLVYRISEQSFVLSSLVITVVSAFFFFFGIVGYSVVRYPGSLVDNTWKQVRGVIAGLFLGVGLIGGMLM